MVFERGWVTLSANIRGKRGRPPTTLGVRKLESLSYITWRCLRHPTSSRFDTIPASSSQRSHRPMYHVYLPNNCARLIPVSWTSIIFIRLESKLQPNIEFILRRVLAMFTRSAITPPKVNRFGWNLEYCEPRGLARADIWRDPRSSDSLRGSRNFICFLSPKLCTISPISRRTIFTNFAHKNVDRCRDVNFPTRILKILSSEVVFPKNAKISRKFSTSDDDFRPPELRNNNRWPETHGQNKCLLDV